MSTNTPPIRHFIFGYGSLICDQSRKITAPTLTNKPAQPVTVHHLRRTWTARCYHRYDHDQKRKNDIDKLIHGQTAMGIELLEGSQTTGVLIEVSEEELAYFDQREGRGYTRCEIDVMHIFDIHDPHKEDHEHQVLKEGHRLRRLSSSETNTIPNGPVMIEELCSKVWVYIPKRPLHANSQYPIMQSYLDIIIRGCLNISEDFAIQYLKSTHGFDVVRHHEDPSPQYVWIDDRADPRYIRADKEWSSEMGHVADEILKQCHPRAVEKRQSIHELKKKSSGSVGGKNLNNGSVHE